jgi:hypothetical protein
MLFQIPAQSIADLLGATSKLASKDQYLRNLNAILLRRCGEYLTATATDCYVLGVARIRLSTDLPMPPDGWRFLVPLSAASSLLRLAKHCSTLDFSDDGFTLTVRSDVGGWSADNVEVTHPEDGRYPSVGPLLRKYLRRIVDAPSIGGLDFAKVGQFVQAQKIFGDSTSPVVIWDTSEKGQPSWALRIGADFVGLVMGMRLPEGMAEARRDVSDWDEILA